MNIVCAGRVPPPLRKPFTRNSSPMRTLLSLVLVSLCLAVPARAQGAAELVESTRRGGGRGTAPERRRAEVHVLNVFGSAASVRVDAGEWVDYMHLARIDGEWKIINVLWELRPASR
jgi:hypothetical protein